MTRTFQFAKPNSENGINPLFLKMKEKFFHDDRAVGDLLRQRMESVELHNAPKATEERDTAAEHRVTRANFLPKEKSASSSHAMRSFESTIFTNRQIRTSAPKKQQKKKEFPLRTLIFGAVCFILVMLMIYSGMTINALKRQLNDANEQLTVKEMQAEELKESVEKRIDKQAIEKEALKNLGMVKIDTVEHVYIDINSGDAVEMHDASRNPDLLLNAFQTSFGN